MKFALRKEENIAGKGEDAGYQHFLLLRNVFKSSKCAQYDPSCRRALKHYSFIHSLFSKVSRPIKLTGRCLQALLPGRVIEFDIGV